MTCYNLNLPSPVIKSSNHLRCLLHTIMRVFRVPYSIISCYFIFFSPWKILHVFCITCCLITLICGTFLFFQIKHWSRLFNIFYRNNYRKHAKILKRNSSPKNENSVIIYSPSSSSKPVWISLFWWTQRKIFWRKFVTRLFWGTIDFHSRKTNTMEGSQWCPRTALFPTFFRISSFVFIRTKTFIQVWNYLRVSKWWQNFHFWVNYPFKVFIFFFEMASGQ